MGSCVQSAFSWAPKVARKCESKQWFACGADGWSVGLVITKFSGVGRFLYPWWSAGVLCARSSAIKLFADDAVVWSGTQFRRCNQSSIWSGQVSWMGKVVANGFQPIEVLRSTCLQNQVSFYTPLQYAWPYPTGCRPLSLPRSFSVREPKLVATYPKHYKQSQFDTWLCQEELASLPTEG